MRCLAYCEDGSRVPDRAPTTNATYGVRGECDAIEELNLRRLGDVMKFSDPPDAVLFHENQQQFVPQDSIFAHGQAGMFCWYIPRDIRGLLSPQT